MNTRILLTLLATIFFIPLFPWPGYAASEIFSGQFTKNDTTNSMYVDIAIPLSSDGVLSIETVEAGCKYQEKAYMYLYTSWGGKVSSVNVSALEPGIPYGPLPLTAGNYRLQLTCLDEEIMWDQNKGLYVGDNGTEVQYAVTVSDLPESTVFAHDNEPDPDDTKAITLTTTQSFEGWMGFAGYLGLKDSKWSDSGIDNSDSYYFTLQKGTSLQVKLDYDARWVNNASGRFPSVAISRWKDGTTYLVPNNWYPSPWTVSGITSDAITLLEDGMYKISVSGGYSSTLPKSNYGGYRMTMVLNGETEPEPEPDLFLTFQDAKWVRQENAPQEDSYNLVINFQVENTYNETKTIRNFASVNAPGVKLVPDNERWDTETNDRAYVLIYYGMMIDAGPHCETNIMAEDLSKYCQYNRLGEDYLHDNQEPQNCLYYVASFTSPYYSIPPHGKIEQTIFIPATLAEYRNFDESLQFIALGIQDQEVHPGDLNNDGCHVHGLYHRPVRASIPSVNNLLLRRK